MTTPTTRTRVRGRGWAYVGALLGGAVSIAANVAHSFVPPTTLTTDPLTGEAVAWSPQPGAVAGATFWPIALFVAVEILARTPWPAGARWAALRWVGLLPVAFVAAVVSYRHLSGLLGYYGEEPLTATLGPLAVDGLMVMATGALLATAPAAVPARTGHTMPLTQPDTTATTAPEAPGESPALVQPTSRPPRPRSTSRGKSNGTAAAITRTRTRHPEWTAAQIAARVGVSERTVRRHLTTGTGTTGAVSAEAPATPTPVSQEAEERPGERAA